MGDVVARIYLTRKSQNLGWTYSRWSIDFGKGESPEDETVTVKCAVTDPRYMSRDDAVAEAKARITLKVKQKCGAVPPEGICWVVHAEE